METWLERTCRKRCLAQAVIFGAATAFCGWLMTVAITTNADNLAGPHPVDAATLAGASLPSHLGHEFVDIPSDGAKDSGVKWIETSSKGRKTETTYWAVPAGGKVLLVKSAARPGARFHGVVKPLDYKLRSQFGAEEQAMLMTITVEDGDRRIGAWIFIALTTGATALTGTLFVRSFRRWQDPARHPAVARLGSSDERFQVSAEVESERALPSTVRIKGRAFTGQFLVDERWYRFDLREWRDLVWAYYKQTKHSWNFIPTGSTFEALLHFSDGKRVVIAAGRSEADVKRMLGIAAQRAPWAAFGYDDRLARSWTKDRAGFRDEVAARRDEIESSPRRAS